jgi:L-fuconolactonase
MTDRPGASNIQKIDSHHHFWIYHPAEYPWITDKMSMLRRDFGPEDLIRETAASGVSGVVSVQAAQTLDETWRLLSFAGHYEFIKGVVGWVPLAGPDLSHLLYTVAANPKLRGVRHILHDEADDFYMLRKDFNRGIAELKPFSLAYDILIFERHLPQTIEFVDRHPDQVFILDHIAKPRIRAGEMSPWRENLRELAKRPHVYCKLSGMVTEADWGAWTDAQLKPYIDVVLSTFTPQRVMFGSDWPVCLVATTYSRWVDTVGRAISGLSDTEKARIWSGTAREAYKL